MIVDQPVQRQLAYKFLQALKRRAKQPGPLPDYVPEEWRGYLLRSKTRHQFSERGYDQAPTHRP